MRDPSRWELAESVQDLAAANPDALTVARADLAHGGKCGEHARVGFEHRRTKAAGVTINRADFEGLDHAFVLTGDLKSEGDEDIVVCDPWPTSPQGGHRPLLRPPVDLEPPRRGLQEV